MWCRQACSGLAGRSQAAEFVRRMEEAEVGHTYHKNRETCLRINVTSQSGASDHHDRSCRMRKWSYPWAHALVEPKKYLEVEDAPARCRRPLKRRYETCDGTFVAMQRELWCLKICCSPYLVNAENAPRSVPYECFRTKATARGFSLLDDRSILRPSGGK